MAAVLLLGCRPGTPDPSAQASETTAAITETSTGTSPETGTETETGSSTETGPNAETETETGAPPCDLDDCTDCEWMVDECGEPTAPVCTDAGECECAQVVPCPPCIERECAAWEACTTPNGTCQVKCEGELTPVIDPPGSCQIQVPFFVQPYLLEIEFDAMVIPWLDANDCASAPQGWIWLSDANAVQLCEQACLAFEAAETVSFKWNLQCN
jgi:hypothetical protein